MIDFKDVEFTYCNTKCQLHLWDMPGSYQGINNTQVKYNSLTIYSYVILQI